MILSVKFNGYAPEFIEVDHLNLAERPPQYCILTLLAKTKVFRRTVHLFVLNVFNVGHPAKASLYAG